jgi:hypothetical protein
VFAHVSLLSNISNLPCAPVRLLRRDFSVHYTGACSSSRGFCHSVSLLPEIPTVNEFVPGYEAAAWLGIGAPKNTPTWIIEKLNQEVNAALSDPKSRFDCSSLSRRLRTSIDRSDGRASPCHVRPPSFVDRVHQSRQASCLGRDDCYTFEHCDLTRIVLGVSDELRNGLGRVSFS